ncbi:perlucin-like isoform X2 [Saccostrea cucullata]|uniref:perlucin-like isoform X2 n=1 Tax=Saccostrea cuccullata TaxID=36930 RepID=UPI002ECFE7E6
MPEDIDIYNTMWVFSTFLLAFLTTNAVAFNPCPESWYLHGRSCYAFVTDLKTDWIEAGAFCERFASHLAEIETQDEDNFLRHHISSNHDTYWVGATDAFEEGHWVWVTRQRPFTYVGWSPGEPVNGVSAACMTLAGNLNHHWNDDYCDRKFSFICEMEIELAMHGDLVG